MVPVPSLWVDGLSNTAQDPEGRLVVLGDMLIPSAYESPYERWSSVELLDLVAHNKNSVRCKPWQQVYLQFLGHW